MFFMLVLDVDKLSADNLAKVAAYDVDKLFSKASTISEGAVLKIHHFVLKEWGPESSRHSSRGYYAAIFDGGKSSLGCSFCLYVDFHPSYDLIHFKLCVFLVYF